MGILQFKSPEVVREFEFQLPDEYGAVVDLVESMPTKEALINLLAVVGIEVARQLLEMEIPKGGDVK